MKRLVIDLDGTITHEDSEQDYLHKLPNLEVIARMRQYKEMGFAIAIFTARNMRTFDGSVGRITAYTVPVIIEWLKKHDIPYDEIHVGKPWCGTDGFYVDDRAIRPDEFVALSHDQILALIGPTSAV